MGLGVQVGHKVDRVVHLVLFDVLFVAGVDRCLVAVVLWDTEKDLLRDAYLFILLRFL